MNCYPRADGLRGRQAGAALLIAMLVMAVGSALAIGLGVTSIVATRRAENQLLADQAWYYLTGAEELAAELLKLKRKEGELAVLAGEVAEAEVEPALEPMRLSGRYSTDHGYLAFDVSDLLGRFNLNSLSQAGAAAVLPDVPNTLEQRRFVRLLRSLDGVELSVEEAIGLTEAVVDWLDTNGLETGFGGAEMAHYAQLPQPYRPADGAMRDVSELLLLKGMTPAIYDALAPVVTVWPLQPGPINVASAPQGVLRALYEQDGLNPLPEEPAKALREALEQREIADLDEFLNRPEWGPTPLAPTSLAATGDVYLITSQTSVGRITQTLDSVVQITDDKTIVLARALRML